MFEFWKKIRILVGEMEEWEQLYDDWLFSPETSDTRPDETEF